MRQKMLLIIVSLVIFLAGCAPGTATSTTAPIREAVYISSSELLIMESYPVQVSLHITGDLPTPCHTFHFAVAAPDAENRIYVTVWSVSNQAAMCTQVLEPFDESISVSMEGAAEGTYSVWLNGEMVEEFSYPG